MAAVVKPKVALFISNLEGGGVQRIILNLSKGLLARGVDVDLVVGRAVGVNLQFVPEGVNLVDLKKSRIFFVLPRLLRYLGTHQPKTLLTAQTHVNLVGVCTKIIYGKRTRLVICEHNDMRSVIETYPKERFRPILARLLYPLADEIVAVSRGVADGLAVLTGISRDRISVLYNPVVNDELTNKMKEPVLHPWFQKGHPPLVLSVGRLEAQKDFETLIRAIALVNQRREAYLMILGKGSQSVVLQDLVNKLGIAKVVEMPGYVENPYAYMARANVFVLSSKYEGFPGVLVEAMACGAPVVSTDCPSGPVEILVEGKYGRLVPVGDVAAMAGAIEATLDQPFSKKDSQRRGLEFNIENTCKGYLNILLPMGEAGI